VAAKTVVAVLDTSVLYGNASRRALVDAIRCGRFDGVWSPHVIGELYRVLTIRWLRTHGFATTSLAELSRASKDMMDVLLAALHLVDTSPSADEALTVLDDADDYHLVRAARLAGASFVVSANTRDFPPKNTEGRHVFEDIEFIECAPFLARIGANEAP
jgi:hypothetical protein